MEYNLIQLILCISVSVLCCYYLCRNQSRKMMLFYILFFFFFTLYSGIGGTMKTANPDYMLYYYGYLLVFVSVSAYFDKKDKKKDIDTKGENVITQYIDQYGGIFLSLYFVVSLAELAFPVNRLGLLLSPPSPDIVERLDFYRDGGQNGVLSYAKIVLNPFFYLCLYKFRHSTIRVASLLVFSLYITYCKESYLGREPMLVCLIIIYFTFLYNSPPNKRRTIIITSIVAVPVLCVFFVAYSYLRVGEELGGSIDFGDAMLLLLEQESKYPLHYDSYYNKSGELISKYFEWLLLLPFPSFIKMGYGGTLFNELFTNIATGRFSWESNFSISLPGIVGEGIFVFKNLFFIHAYILAYVSHITMKYVTKYECFMFLYFYATFKLPMGFARSGTQGVYSTIAKALIFVLILYIYKKNKRTYNSNFRVSIR